MPESIVRRLAKAVRRLFHGRQKRKQSRQRYGPEIKPVLRFATASGTVFHAVVADASPGGLGITLSKVDHSTTVLAELTEAASVSLVPWTPSSSPPGTPKEVEIARNLSTEADHLEIVRFAIRRRDDDRAPEGSARLALQAILERKLS